MYKLKEEIREMKEYFSRHLTEHAKKRQSQRGISIDDMVITILLGEEFYQKTGSIAYYFSNKSKKNKKLKPIEEKLAALTGTAVILSQDNYIITTFKNKNLKNIKKRFKKS